MKVKQPKNYLKWFATLGHFTLNDQVSKSNLNVGGQSFNQYKKTGIAKARRNKRKRKNKKK